LLQKSFSGGERKCLEPLVRFKRSDFVADFGNAVDGHLFAGMAKFGLISQALTGLFLQAANERSLRDKMPEFGTSWRLEPPPTQNDAAG
jgi:hypothetical protein